jgi:hypothetical protein
MNGFIGTLYAHEADFQGIIAEIRNLYPKAIYDFEQTPQSEIANITFKGGLFKSDNLIKINYRQRLNSSYKLEKNECPLSANLLGMMGFVDSLPSNNQQVKALLLRKIETLNVEFSFFLKGNSQKEVTAMLKHLALKLDALVFAQPNTSISQSTTQHFLDKNLALILDTLGNNQISKLEVVINSKYFDQPENEPNEEQKQRKANSEKLIASHQIPINYNLPCIEAEDKIDLRNVQEIAQRVVALSITNGVAFDYIPAKEAMKYMTDHQLFNILTPKEIAFLKKPTEQQKIQETWKVECIWTLMWALKIVEDLEFPDHLADLNTIPFELFPIGEGKNPNDFIQRNTVMRSKSEIIDMNDLYYRLDWACVDAQVKGLEMQIVHPSVVYERHYALNWLIKYMNQEWDDVSADT